VQEDPLVTAFQATLVESAADNPSDSDEFAASVALSGDTVLVGAPGKLVSGIPQGAVFVFTRAGAVWTEQALLTGSAADVPAAIGGFGSSVALSGDTALIGAPLTGSGAAFVFTRSGTTWTEQAVLMESAADVYTTSVGSSVALSGDTALVGASSGNSLGGAAFVFTCSGTVWTEQAVLTESAADMPALQDEFGASLALNGDTAVIGAPMKSVSGLNGQGAAFVFTRSGTAWTEQAVLMKSAADMPAANDLFGYSVALNGDTAIIGAPTVPPTQQSGVSNNRAAAFLFTRAAALWTEQAILAAGETMNTFFGSSVAAGGNVAAIAAPDFGFAKDSGLYVEDAVFIFAGSGAQWTQQYLLPGLGTTYPSQTSLAFDPATSTLAATDYSNNFSDSQANVALVYTLPTPSPNGTTCNQDAACASGYCEDGVCCDTACAGSDPYDCEACSTMAGAAGNGSCSFLSATTVCNPSTGQTCSGNGAQCPPSPPGSGTMPTGCSCSLLGARTDPSPMAVVLAAIFLALTAKWRRAMRLGRLASIWTLLIGLSIGCNTSKAFVVVTAQGIPSGSVTLDERTGIGSYMVVDSQIFEAQENLSFNLGTEQTAQPETFSFVLDLAVNLPSSWRDLDAPVLVVALATFDGSGCLTGTGQSSVSPFSSGAMTVPISVQLNAFIQQDCTGTQDLVLHDVATMEDVYCADFRNCFGDCVYIDGWGFHLKSVITLNGIIFNSPNVAWCSAATLLLQTTMPHYSGPLLIKNPDGQTAQLANVSF
jgi:hypothetical protein